MGKLVKVKVKRGTSEELTKIFKVSRVWVSKALNGKTNSAKAQKIRKAAVNAGGDGIYK